MNPDDSNRWVTLIANISIVLGLVFVGLELRNSSNAVDAQIINSVSTGYNEINATILSDPEISRIMYIGYREPDRLSDLELLRFLTAFNTILNQFRRVHELYQEGLISESQWSTYAPEMAYVLDLPASRMRFENSGPPEPFYSDIMRYRDRDSSVSVMFGRGPLDIPKLHGEARD